jgi:predicted nucleic acid-binding protein
LQPPPCSRRLAADIPLVTHNGSDFEAIENLTILTIARVA